MTHVSDAASVAHLDKLYASGVPAPYKPAGGYVSDLAAVAAANGREDYMLEAIADLKTRAKEGGGVPNRNAPFAAGQRQMAQTLTSDKTVSEEVGLMEKRLKDAKRLKSGTDWRARLAQDDKTEFGRYLREKWEADDIGRDLFRASQQLGQTGELMDATGRRFVGEQLGKTGSMETLGKALSELTKAGLLGQREVSATGPDGMPMVDASGNPVRRMTTPDENYNAVLGQIHKDMAAVAAGGEPSGETAKAIADGAVPGYDLEAYKKDLKTTADTMAGEPLGDDSVVEGLAATHADLAEMNRKRKQLEDLENVHKEAKRRLDEEWTEEKVKERAEKKASTVPPAAVASAAPAPAPAPSAAPAAASPPAEEKAEETPAAVDDPLEEAFRDVEPLPKTPPPPPSSEGWFSAVDTNLFGFTDAGSGRDPLEAFDGDSREAVSAALVRMSDNLLLLCGHNSGSEVEDGKTVHPKKRIVALPAGEHATSVRQKPDGTFEDTQKDKTPLPKGADGPLALYVETDKGIFRAVGYVNEKIPVPKDGVTPATVRESAAKKGFAGRLAAAPGSVFYVSFQPGEVGVNTPGAEGRTVAADTGVPTDSLSDGDLDALYEKASKGMYIVEYDRGWRGKLERAHAAVRHMAEGVRKYMEAVLPQQIGEDLAISDLVGGVFVDLGGRLERLISSKPDSEAGWRTVLDRLDKTSDFLKDLTAWAVETAAAAPPSDKDPDAGKFTAFKEALWGVLLGTTNAPMVDHEGRLDFDVAYDDAGFTLRRGGDSHRVSFDWKSAALEAGETTAPDYGEKLRDGLSKALVAVTGFTLRTGINPTTLPSIGGFGTKYAVMDADRSSRTGLFSLVLGLTRTAMEGKDRVDGSRSFTFVRPDAGLMPKFAVEEPREVPKVEAVAFSADGAFVEPPATGDLDAVLDKPPGSAPAPAFTGTLFSSAEAPAEGDFGPADGADAPVVGITYEVRNPLTGASEAKTLDAIPGFVQGLTNYLAKKLNGLGLSFIGGAYSTGEVRGMVSDFLFTMGEGAEDRHMADVYEKDVLTPIREKRAETRSGTAEYDRLLELETAHQAVADALRNAQPGNDAFGSVMRESWWEMLGDEMERLHDAEELLNDQLGERNDGSEDPAEKDEEAPPELSSDPQWSSPEKKKLFQKARAMLNAAFRDTWVTRKNERGVWEEVRDKNGFPVPIPWTSVVAAVAQKMNAPDTRHEWEQALADNAGPKTPALSILKNLYDRLMESPQEKDRLLASLLYTQTSLVPVQYVQVSMPSDLHKATKSFSANRGGNWLTRFFSWKTSVDKQKDDDVSSRRFANRVALAVRLAGSGFTGKAVETLGRLNLLVNATDSVPQASEEEIRKTAVMVEGLYREYYGIELGVDAVETLLREGHKTTLDFHAAGKPKAESGHRFYKFADFMPQRTGGNSPSQMAAHLVMEVQRMTGYVQKLSNPDVFVDEGLEEIGAWADVQAFLGELSGFESKKGYQPIARIGVKTINAMMDRFYLHTRTKRAAQDKGKASPMRTTMDRMKGRERDNAKALETFSKLYGAMSSNPQKDENQTAHMTPREELTMRFDQLFQRMWTTTGKLTSHYMTPAASDSGSVFLLQGRFYGTMKAKGKAKGVLEVLQAQAIAELDRILAAGQVAKESAESGSAGLNLKGFDAEVESDSAVRRGLGQVFVTFGFLNTHPKLAPFMTNGFLDPAKMGVLPTEEDVAALEAAGEDPLAVADALRGTLTGAVKEAVEEHFASAERAKYVLDSMVAAGLMQVDKSGNYRLRKTFPKINMYDPSNDREYAEFRDAWNKMFPENGFLKVEGSRVTAVKVTPRSDGKKSFTDTEIQPEENALLLWYLNDLANQVDFQERYADPAAFAKPDKGTYVADVASSLRKTFANYFKRLKGLVTPVKIGAWGSKKTVRIAILADEEVDYDRVTYTDAGGVQKMQLLPTEQAVALEKQLLALKTTGVEGIQVKRERHGRVNRTDAQAYNTPLSYYSNLVAAGELTAGRAFGTSMDGFRAAIAEERRNGTLVGGHTPLIDPKTGFVSTDDAVLDRAFGDSAKDVKESLWYQMHSPILEDGTHPAQDEAVSLKTAAFGPDAGVSLYASDKAERDRIAYLKCSETPLLPAFLPQTFDEAGTPIPNRFVGHLVRMYDDDVDVLAHTSAIKAGERFDQQVSEADPKWAPEKILELDIRHYGIQMRTRTQRKKQISMGTQLMDLMRLNASSEGVKKALEEYKNQYTMLVARGHVRWMEQWGLDPATATVANPVLFEKRRNDLARQAYKEGRISRNTYSAVLNGGLDVRYLPADFGSVMAAEYDKMAVQPKLPGTGLVQISDKLYEGYPGAESLQAPTLVANPDGTTYMQPGQALVGWPWSRELWIRYKTDAAFRQTVDAKFGRSVAYRLPTSGLNSSTYVQMVFLPPQAGQVCAMNPATVAILGADFDVDKIWMYFRDLEAFAAGRLDEKGDEDAQIKDAMFLALEQTYAQADAERFKAMTTPVSPETVQKLAAEGKEKWDAVASNPNAQWNDMFQMANQRRNASISKSMVGPATMWVKVLARFGRVGAYLHGELPTATGPGGVSVTTGFNPRYQPKKSAASLTGNRTFVKFTDGSSSAAVVAVQGGAFVPADDPLSLEHGKFQEAPRGKGAAKPEDTLEALQNYILDLAKTSDADGLGLNPETQNAAGLMAALGYDANIIFALLSNPAVRAYVEYRALAQDSMASTSASKDPVRILEGVRLVAKDRGQTSTFSTAKEDLFRRLVNEEYDEEAVGDLANYKGDLFIVTVDAKKLVERKNTGFAANDDDLDALAAFIAFDEQARDVARHNSETNLIAHGMDGAFEDRDTYIRSILEGAGNPQVAKVLADDYTNGMHGNWQTFHRIASEQSVDALAHRRAAMEAVDGAGLGWLKRDAKMGSLLNRVIRRNLWMRIGGLSGGTDLYAQAAFGRLESEIDLFRHDPRFSAFLGLFEVKGYAHREGAYVPVLEWAGGLNLEPSERDAAVRAFESMLADPMAGGFAQRLVFYTYRYHGTAGVNGSWFGAVPSSHIRAATLGVNLEEEGALEALRYYGYESREAVLAETEHMADRMTETDRVLSVLERMETETDPETGKRVHSPDLKVLSLFFDEASQWMTGHFPKWDGGKPPSYTKRDALGVSVNPDGSFKGLYRAKYEGDAVYGEPVYEKPEPPVEVDDPVTDRLKRVLDDLTGKEGVGSELASAMGALFDSPTRGIGKTKVVYVDGYGAGKHGAYIPSANVVLIYEKTIADEVRKRGVPEGSTEEAEIAKFKAAVEFEELVHAATYLQIRTNKDLADRWDKLYKEVKTAYDAAAAKGETGGLREADFANPDELAAAFLRALAGDPKSDGLPEFLNSVTHKTDTRERGGLLGKMKALFVKAFEALRSALSAVEPKAGTALEAMYDLAADTLASVPVGRHVVRSEGIKTEPSQWSDWVSKMEDYYRTEPGRKWC